jgi:hypothetical protein
MKTVDGNKNSALPLLEFMNSKAIERFLKKSKRTMISKSREH